MENADLSCFHLSIPIECARQPDTDTHKAADRWHSGQDSGLYRIVCNGCIPDLDMPSCVEYEIEHILGDPEADASKTAADRVDYEALKDLLAESKEYVRIHGDDVVYDAEREDGAESTVTP